MHGTDLERLTASVVAGRRVVVGLSGGLDSVVLLNALVRGGADVRAAHIDHGLRADSTRDAALSATIAANLGIPFASARLEISRGNSTQGRARHQRYAALVRLGAEMGADVLAVAHHADDASESSQLQSDRAAGPVGRAGPRQWATWRGFDVVRPLLEVPRAHLFEYARAWNLIWTDDPSNQDVHYARARLREASRPLTPNQMEARREAAESLSAQTSEIEPTSRSPLTITFDRLTLTKLHADIRARILLDTARRLHGELGGRLVTDIAAALADSATAPRDFTGRRTIVTITTTEVVVAAARGQGTRLHDRRATPEIAVFDGLEVPWFNHRIASDVSEGIRLRDIEGVTLRGPCAGDQIRTAEGPRSVAAVLAQMGISARERWSWPCFWRAGQCVAIAESDVVSSDPILLPRGDKSGIFLGWERFVPRDFAVQPPRSRR